jgi:iron complex outermembrane recepter protein
MKPLILVVIALSFFISAYNQSVSGYIYEKENNKPLEGATIYMPELMIGAISDASGFFEIKNLKKGRYLLQFSILGYGAQSQQIPIPNETPIQIYLSKSEYTVNEIVVTGGKLSRIDETPYQIQSISADEISTSGNVSLMDALSQVPGIEQISYGTGIGKPVIRGLSFSRIMTLYRGIRFENQQWGEDHGLGVTSSGIDRIEVVKGPASLIYGSGALGGVINLIDEKPAATQSTSGDASITAHSNSLGVATDLGVKGTSEKGGFWILRNSFQNHADYTDGNNRTIGNSRFNTKSIKADAGVLKNWGSIRFSYTFANQQMGIIDEDEMEETLASTKNDRKMQLPFQNISDHIFTLQNNVLIGENRLKFTLGHHINLREEIEDEFNEVDLGIRLSTTTYDFNYTFFPHEKGEYTFGYQGFLQQNLNYENAGEILLPDAWLYDNGIFGLAKYKFGSFNILAGSRFDYRRVVANSSRLEDFILPGNPEDETLRRSFGGFTGSVGLSYVYKSKLNIKLNVASGFRAPDLAELFSNGEHPGTNRFEIGNDNFNREQNLETDLSLSYHHKDFSLEVAAFYNHILNYIYFSPTAEQINNLTIWRFYQNNARLYGGEAGIEFHPSRFPFLQAKTNFSTVTANRLDDNSPLPLIPANRFFNELKFVKTDWKKLENTFISFRVNNVLQQNRIAADEQITSAYHLLHIATGTGIELGKYVLEVSLSVNNLLNTAYYDHLAITRPFEIHNMGRNFRLTTRFKF